MDTISNVRAAAAAVIGSRHLRAARNGQDAAAAWTGESIGESIGAVVVCDGCGASASSEVGARIGAQLVIAALARELAAGAEPADPAMWDRVRAYVVAALSSVVDAMTAGTDDLRARIVHDHFLFTIVAAAVGRETAAVWAVGDGAYAIAARARELGPFTENQPPYVGYDLLGFPPASHLEVVSTATAGAIVVATDGVGEVGLDVVSVDGALAHPDALRRRLVVLARGEEAIDWERRRVVRTPARLQDDGAVGVIAWRGRAS